MSQTTSAKHGIKQIDRFLGNPRIDLEVACGDLITTVIGSAKEVHLTLDWTDPKTKDGQFQTLSCNVRAHGRALPIAWVTVPKAELKHHMREYEHALCTRVAQLMPSSCHVILLADQGFATVHFFRVLDALGWDWTVRTKGNILWEIDNRWLPLLLLGKTRPIALDTLQRSKGGAYAGRLIVYADSRHADPWFLLVSAELADRSWSQIVATYGQRFTCEES